MIGHSIEVGWKSSVEIKVTDKMVRQFAEMSGDHNPIHLDDDYAAKTRFKRRIAHGMISGALISRSLIETIGPGGVYLGQTMKFVNPVFIDDTIVIELEATNVRKEKGIVMLTTNVRKKDGDYVLKGDATVMLSAAEPVS